MKKGKIVNKSRKSPLKVGLSVLIAAQVSGFSQLALGETPTVMVPAGQTPSFFGGSGTYNFDQFNVAEIMKTINASEQYRAVGQQNLAKIETFLKLISEQMKEIQDKNFSADVPYNPATKSGKNNLAGMAISGASIPASDYLLARQQYVSAMLNLQSTIAVIKGTVDAVQTTPSEINVTLASKTMATSFPGPLKEIVIAQALGPLEANLAEIQKAANSLTIRVISFDGRVMQAEGASLKPADLGMPYTEIARMQAEITANKGFKGEEERQLAQYPIAIRGKINSIMDTADKDGYLLTDKKFESDAITGLEEIFLTRSYLRLVFGTPIGGLLVNTEGTESFYGHFISNSSKLKWRSEIGFNLNDAESQMRDMRAALSVASSRSLDFSKIKEEIGQPLWLTFSSVASAITLFAGKKDMEKYKAAVLMLLLADYEEEAIVTKAGGIRLMKERFQARYASTPELKAHFGPIVKNVAEQVGQSVAGKSSGTYGTTDHITGNAYDLVGAVVGVLRVVQIRMETVRKNEQFIEDYRKDFSTTLEEKERAGGILDMFK